MEKIARRRRARLGLGVLAMGSLFANALVAPTANAQTIAQTKAIIAALTSKLSNEQHVSETLANRYDADRAQFQGLTANIVHLQGQEVVVRQHIATTTQRLVKAVVQTYVYGAAASQVQALFNQNVTTSDARSVYEGLVVGNLNALKEQLTTEKQHLSTVINQVAAERTQAHNQTEQMQSLLAQNEALASQTQATLSAVTARLRTEIINYEIAAGAQAARNRDAAAEAAAVAAASSVGGQSAANLVLEAIAANTPPPPIVPTAGSAAGDEAVRAAESQVGVPYVWGGETPGVGFDCSGLVQWAWGRAGVSIPRTTETQYPALHHISLNNLEPGDLLYYFNLDGDGQIDHVVMYVGSGPYGKNTIIAASQTGVPIGYQPLYTYDFYGAARP